MIDWSAIDTVLLDMDGTLLDLHFDNYFWLTHLPERFAEHHGIQPDEATRQLHQRFNEKRGTLDWYCLDYWSQQLAMDIRSMKKEIRHLIRERPHALAFLQWLGNAGIQRVLITNAHPDSLSLKLSVTGIEPLLDIIISSHDYRSPKEAPLFWQKLQQQVPFDKTRTLFIDDSEAVLNAAHKFGIEHLYSIAQPDSQQDHCPNSAFPVIHHFDDTLPSTSNV